jgi:sugar phosphate permease
MAIVKAFKAKDTVWGVLSIFLPICALIWLFMKKQTKLAVYWIVAIVLYIIGFTLIGGAVAANPDLLIQ